MASKPRDIYGMYMVSKGHDQTGGQCICRYRIEYGAYFLYLPDAGCWMLMNSLKYTGSNRAASIVQIQDSGWQRVEAHLGDMLHVVQVH